jgi:hypothetical protein
LLRHHKHATLDRALVMHVRSATVLDCSQYPCMLCVAISSHAPLPPSIVLLDLCPLANVGIGGGTDAKLYE